MPRCVINPFFSISENIFAAQDSVYLLPCEIGANAVRLLRPGAARQLLHLNKPLPHTRANVTDKIKKILHNEVG